MATPSVDPGALQAGEYVPSAETAVAGRNFAIATQAPRAIHASSAVHSSKRQIVKTYVLLLCMLLFGTAGNVILDKGMKGVGAVDLSSSRMVWNGIARTLMSGAIWGGIACLLLYMLSYMLVLSLRDAVYGAFLRGSGRERLYLAG
jgi:hypothetical protein